MTAILDSMDHYNPALGEVVVQFWVKPGEAAAVVLGAGEEPPVERIPEQLKPYL